MYMNTKHERRILAQLRNGGHNPALNPDIKTNGKQTDDIHVTRTLTLRPL